MTSYGCLTTQSLTLDNQSVMGPASRMSQLVWQKCGLVPLAGHCIWAWRKRTPSSNCAVTSYCWLAARFFLVMKGEL